jgi:Ankyrin repeats (3 copies)/TRAF-type zinc finger
MRPSAVLACTCVQVLHNVAQLFFLLALTLSRHLFANLLDCYTTNANNACRTDSAALLLDAGADPNQRVGTQQRTALIVAAAAGCADVTRLLLERGADVTIADANGHTPLQCAVQGGFTDIAALLTAAADDDSNTGSSGTSSSKGITDTGTTAAAAADSTSLVLAEAQDGTLAVAAPVTDTSAALPATAVPTTAPTATTCSYIPGRVTAGRGTLPRAPCPRGCTAMVPVLESQSMAAYMASAHAAVCPLCPVQCPLNCGDSSLVARDLTEHVQEQCAARQCECRDCGDAMLGAALQCHQQSVCRGRRVVCQLCKEDVVAAALPK